MGIGRRGVRELVGPLLAVNLVVYLIVLGLAAWSLDKYIDGEQDHPRTFSLSHINNIISYDLLAYII